MYRKSNSRRYGMAKRDRPGKVFVGMYLESEFAGYVKAEARRRMVPVSGLVRQSLAFFLGPCIANEMKAVAGEKEAGR